MLYKFCVFALLAVQALSTSRYFVDLFQSSYNWAYPLDMCVATGVLSGNNIKFMCSEDGMTVTKYIYASNDYTCSKTYTTEMFNASSTMIDGLYEFNCNGTDDYLEAKLRVGSCSSSLSTNIYTAVNACFKFLFTNTTFDIYEQAQCDSTTAPIVLYASIAPTCDVLDGFTQVYNSSEITTTCSLYTKSGSTKVYSQLENCVYDGYSNFPQTMSNSAMFTGNEVGTEQIDIMITAWAETEYVNNSNETMSDPMVCSIPWFQYFNSSFKGSLVTVTTTCDSHYGQGYQSIMVSAGVTIFDDGSFQDCATIVSMIDLAIEDTYENIMMNTTCYEYPITTTIAPSTTMSAGAEQDPNWQDHHS